MLGIRARRRAGVTVALAGMLGGAMVGFSSVEGATAPAPGGSAVAKPAASPTFAGSPTQRAGGSTGSPTHSAGPTGSPTHSAGPTGSPTLRAISGSTTFTPGPSPVSSPQGSPVAKASPSPSPRGAAPVSSATPSPGPKSPAASPSAAARTAPTPNPGSNDRNANWKHDSQSWKQWDGAWQDPNWRSEHSRDSRHEHGFFSDRDHWCDRHDCDRFHTDEFRNEDRSFRHDCDVLLSFHRIRDLLDFLDSDVSLRDFFELHGDLFDFLVHHSDQFDEFDSDCTFIIIHG